MEDVTELIFGCQGFDAGILFRYPMLNILYWKPDTKFFHFRFVGKYDRLSCSCQSFYYNTFWLKLPKQIDCGQDNFTLSHFAFLNISYIKIFLIVHSREN